MINLLMPDEPVSGLEKQLSDKLLSQSETLTARRKAFFQRLGRNWFPFALMTAFAVGGYNLKEWADKKDLYIESHSKPYVAASEKINSLRNLVSAGKTYGPNTVKIDMKMQDDIRADIRRGRDGLYPKEADEVLAFMKDHDDLFDTKNHSIAIGLDSYLDELSLKTMSLKGSFRESGYDVLWLLGWISTYIASSLSLIAGCNIMNEDGKGRIPTPRESQDSVGRFLRASRRRDETSRSEVLVAAANYVNHTDEKRFELFHAVEWLTRLDPKKHPRTIAAINSGRCKTRKDLFDLMRDETPELFYCGI